MFFVLSKLVYWLVMPISIIAWVIIAAIFTKIKKWQTGLLYLALGLFLFFTNPLLATLAINAWEHDYKKYEALGCCYDIGIVLTGIANPDREPFDRIQFNKGADRIVQAIELYKRGIVRKILISGGSGSLTFDGKKESHQLKKFAQQSGIPEDDIIVEDQSRNTNENARNMAEILLPLTSEKQILITSAFHMYRSKKCFEKTGMTVTTFPTDHYGRPVQLTPDGILIPSLYGLRVWTILTKEWLGILAYKIAGYI